MTRKFSKLIVLFVLTTFVLASSGCSISGLSEKIFGKSKAEAKLGAEFVHIDNTAINQAVIDLINGAKQSIYVEQYEFDRKDLMDLLAAKAKSGVEVKVLLDQSTKSAKSTLDYLKSKGVGIQYYPTEKGQFNKAKLLAVDCSRAIIGGNDWTAAAAGFHNAAIELNGSSAWKTAEVFARDWNRSTTLDLKLADSPTTDDHILLATNSNIQSMAISEIQDSKSSIQLEMSLLTYPDELIGLLADAAGLGRKVQIILDPQYQDYNQDSIDKLKSAGAQIRHYPTDANTRFDAKFALFDGEVTILGSSNWSRSSFVLNHELAVIVPSKAVTAKLAEQFAADWDKSKEIEKPQPKS